MHAFAKLLAMKKKQYIIIVLEQHLLLCLIYVQEYMLMSSDLGLISLTELRGQDTRSQKNKCSSAAVQSHLSVKPQLQRKTHRLAFIYLWLAHFTDRRDVSDERFQTCQWFSALQRTRLTSHATKVSPQTWTQRLAGVPNKGRVTEETAAAVTSVRININSASSVAEKVISNNTRGVSR